MATVSFTPAEKIYFHSPMYYSPTITVEGEIRSTGHTSLQVDIQTEAYDHALACIWKHSFPEKIGKPFVCVDRTMGMEEFMMIVSRDKAAPNKSDFVNPHKW